MLLESGEQNKNKRNLNHKITQYSINHKKQVSIKTESVEAKSKYQPKVLQKSFQQFCRQIKNKKKSFITIKNDKFSQTENIRVSPLHSRRNQNMLQNYDSVKVSKQTILLENNFLISRKIQIFSSKPQRKSFKQIDKLCKKFDPSHKYKQEIMENFQKQKKYAKDKFHHFRFNLKINTQYQYQKNETKDIFSPWHNPKTDYHYENLQFNQTIDKL